MSDVPFTLRGLSGLSAVAPRWADSALLVIDAQRAYEDGILRLPGMAVARRHLAEALAIARKHGAPVIHVWHEGGAGGPFDPAGSGFAPLVEAQPLAGERVVRKRLPDSFAGTDLDAAIAATGRSSLIVVGFMTHMCVDSTVRSALNRGHPCGVVAKACASRDLPGPSGPVAAATMHAASLAALGDRCAGVVDTAAAVPE
jgi:nicotinamidase-related amidase